MGFPTRICRVLKYDPLNNDWNWKRIYKEKFTSLAFLTKEGLYFEKCDGVQKVVNLHTNEAIVLPCTNEDNEPDMIRCMVVDTSANTLQFKVIIGGYARNTLVYDSNSPTSMWNRLSSTYPLRDMQEWMTSGGTVVYHKNIVFILYHWRTDIVVFFMDIDKWGFITPPSDKYESLLCGIGCLDGRIYCSTTDEKALHIWRLDNLENDLEKQWEWENFDSMPSGDYHWLLHNNDHTQVRIFTSFCNHQVLFYSYSAHSSHRLVLFDLEGKRPWKKLSLLFKFETLQVENIQVKYTEDGDHQDKGYREAYKSGTSTSLGRSMTDVPLGTIREQPSVIDSFLMDSSLDDLKQEDRHWDVYNFKGVEDGYHQGDGYGEANKSGTSTSHGRSMTDVPLGTIREQPSVIDSFLTDSSLDDLKQEDRHWDIYNFKGVEDGDHQGEGYGEAYKSGTSTSHGRSMTDVSLGTIGQQPSAIDNFLLITDSSLDDLKQEDPNLDDDMNEQLDHNMEKESKASQHASQQPSASKALTSGVGGKSLHYRASNWGREETMQLAELRRSSNEVGMVMWERIASTMSTQFPHDQAWTAKQCRQRWDTLTKLYGVVEQYCNFRNRAHTEISGEQRSLRLPPFDRELYSIVKEVRANSVRKRQFRP